MRWSAEKLRWILLGGALLLAGIVAALFGLANYRAGKVWQRILARNGVNLRRETDGFTYSQSDGKRTVFTLHAAKAVPHGKDHWSLREAVLILYGKDGRTDRIYGNQFEYDEGAGVASAVGDVHMDLEAPQARDKGTSTAARPDLSFTFDDQSAADPALIHVRTSGLVYTRKSGLARTDQPAEFRYKGLTCISRGAEFDAGQNALRLLAEVHLTGTVHETPFTLTAARAVLDRNVNTTDLLQPEFAMPDRGAHAAHALLHLRRDGSLEAGEADGGVQMHRGAEILTASQLHALFGAENRPEQATLSGGVTFSDAEARRSTSGMAKTVDLSMTPQGTLRTALAQGQVSLLVKEGAAANRITTREMHAETALASFAVSPANPRQMQLRALHMMGAAEFAGQTPSAKPGTVRAVTRVQADDLTTTFVAGVTREMKPQRMVGSGHTNLAQSGADHGQQVSTGDALDVSFSQRPLSAADGAGTTVEVASAVQTGHVQLHTWPAVKAGAAQPEPTVGHAQQAVYTAGVGTLTLTGAGVARAEITDGATDLRAAQIVLHQGTGDGEASGGVAATTGGDGATPATHILAERAALLHVANQSQFFGTDAHPAQLWQGGSQVQAARITLDGRHHTLAARPELPRGVVNAVFAAGTGAKSAQTPVRPPVVTGRSTGHETPGLTGHVPEASRDSVQVRAAAMDYNDLQHEATFTGGVTMRGSEGEVEGEHGAAFLQAADATTTKTARDRATPETVTGSAPGVANLGEHLERLVLVGDVHLRQPGRVGAGAQITYTASTGSFVLTGTAAAPPQVRDQQQGVVTGATLLFGAADSSIVVAGTRPTPKQAAGTRVHTETDLQKQ